jgi:hypothetical protein
MLSIISLPGKGHLCLYNRKHLFNKLLANTDYEKSIYTCCKIWNNSDEQPILWFLSNELVLKEIRSYLWWMTIKCNILQSKKAPPVWRGLLKAAGFQIYAFFHENFKNEIKCRILYSNQKVAIYTLSMALTTQFNYKICNQKNPSMR